MEILQEKLLTNTACQTVKAHFREHLKKQMLSISALRRMEAKRGLEEIPLPQGLILSFSSFSSEIDTSSLNKRLLQEERLVLPHVSGDLLLLYHGDDQIDPCSIACALIPGLGFDASNMRLGRGKGYYDRFLKTLPLLHTIGIGFQEQYVDQLPCEPHDIPLSRLSLF